MDCEHKTTELRKQRIANGRFYLRFQCLDCGELVGTFQKQAGVDMSDLSEIDIAFRERMQRQRWDRQRRDAERKRLQRHLRYEAHLNSPEWSAKRQLVLKRDGYTCRCCLTAHAQEVHHLSYEHLGDEYGWELQSVCRPCHERVHGIGEPEHIGSIVQKVMDDLDPCFCCSDEAVTGRTQR